MSSAEDVIKLRRLVADHSIAMISTSAPFGEAEGRLLVVQPSTVEYWS